jgi:6-pyruvoyltetrahydropterin/6-carboxytetrahydropterin synthase
MIGMISKSFTFEAAHKLSNTKNNENNNIHGHSFSVEVFISDINNNIKLNGIILDFSIFKNKIDKIKNILDHSFLNNIQGLEYPTLENIGYWVFHKLEKDNLTISKVIVQRKSCGESFTLSK